MLYNPAVIMKSNNRNSYVCVVACRSSLQVQRSTVHLQCAVFLCRFFLPNAGSINVAKLKREFG